MIDQRQFRDLMSGVCAPVTVVTTTVGDAPYEARPAIADSSAPAPTHPFDLHRRRTQTSS